MKILMRDGYSAIALPSLPRPVAFVGEVVDERGGLAIEAIHVSNLQPVRFRYDERALEVDLDAETIAVDSLVEWIGNSGAQSLYLEATTLSFADLFVLSHAARQANVKRLVFQYVEPRGYSEPKRERVLHARDFDLSSEVPGFIGIPGRSIPLDHARSQRVLFLVGYEGERLDRAFENLNLEAKNCGVVFGVPAFACGWEMNTFTNIAPVMLDRGLKGGVYYCPADNPLSVYEFLEEQYRTHNGENVDFVVSPIGTKPHGIGALLFLLEREEVGLLYDHPSPRLGRTSDSLTWHQFDVSW
jgi:hypothetical protein